MLVLLSSMLRMQTACCPERVRHPTDDDAEAADVRN